MWTDVARERYRDNGRRYPSNLTDAEWRTIEPVLWEGRLPVTLPAQGVRHLADSAELARPVPGRMPQAPR